MDLDATASFRRGKVGKSGKKLERFEVCVLDSILTGSVRPCRRFRRAKRWHDPKCPFCFKNQDEDKEHMWWECDAWELIRQMYTAELDHGKFGWGQETEREGNPALW